MNVTSYAKKYAKRLLVGAVEYPQQCPIALREPQREVSVYVNASGERYEVTDFNFMLCGAPFTIGIGLESKQSVVIEKCRKPVLQFRSHDGRTLLGEITLRLSCAIDMGRLRLLLFHADACRNYCLPKTRLWGRYLFYAYQRSNMPATGVPITAREVAAMIVFYICPRPVVLATVTDGEDGNIFPMNLMGPMGADHFVFALNASTPASALVKRAGALAISSIPFEQTRLAFEFGKNHKKQRISWGELPFQTFLSSRLSQPVPTFARRVRELQIETSYTLGSHVLFVARILSDEWYAAQPECFIVHGIYQTWRSARQVTDRVIGVS